MQLFKYVSNPSMVNENFYMSKAKQVLLCRIKALVSVCTHTECSKDGEGCKMGSKLFSHMAAVHIRIALNIVKSYKLQDLCGRAGCLFCVCSVPKAVGSQFANDAHRNKYDTSN